MPPNASFPAFFPSPADSSALRRVGILTARNWHAKLYAAVPDADELRPEDLAAASRAYRAAIAAPDATARAGFALLRPRCGDGLLSLSVCWWEGTALHRTLLVLQGCGNPPRRDDAGRVGSVDEVLLMAREAAAWRRCVLDADVPSLDAYGAECCA